MELVTECTNFRVNPVTTPALFDASHGPRSRFISQPFDENVIFGHIHPSTGSLMLMCPNASMGESLYAQQRRKLDGNPQHRDESLFLPARDEEPDSDMDWEETGSMWNMDQLYRSGWVPTLEFGFRQTSGQEVVEAVGEEPLEYFSEWYDDCDLTSGNEDDEMGDASAGHALDDDDASENLHGNQGNGDDMH